jgi:iron complex outermembrane receptor protein
MAHAATATDSDTGGLEEIVVTAQKQSENLQNVPIAIEAFDSQKLEQLNVVNLDDYVKYSPSVAYVRGQGQGGNGQPGSSHVYMRGVVSGGDGNHSGSQPSVGTYLDEQPVTTIDGTIDMHIYDVQRIEVSKVRRAPCTVQVPRRARSASSPTSPIRPNSRPATISMPTTFSMAARAGKPRASSTFPSHRSRPSAWSAGMSTTAAISTTSPARMPMPVSRAACAPFRPGRADRPAIIRRCHPVPPGVIGAGAISNAAYRQQQLQYGRNARRPRGAQIRHRRQLDGDSHHHGPVARHQRASSATTPRWAISTWCTSVPETPNDSFTQSALTVEGKFSDFDLVYAGAYMKRTTHSIADYSDYSEFYDRITGRAPLDQWQDLGPAPSCRRNWWSRRATSRSGAMSCA